MEDNIDVDFKGMENQIDRIKEKIKEKIEPFIHFTIILILGLTGSGKSSLVQSLLNNELTVKRGLGKNNQLVGEGVFAGCKVGTEELEVYPDKENMLLFCDCPGFEDLRGLDSEVVNAFVVDYILNSEEHDVNLKILLVSSDSEFDSKRGKAVYDTILRLKQMFPNPGDLRNSIGFVITKGNENKRKRDYFIELENRASPELKEWCDFFKCFDNQVFLFPMPSDDMINKQYDFKDRVDLMKFVKTNPLKNPRHKIVLSKEMLFKLQYIRCEHFKEANDIVESLFLDINEEFRNSNEPDTIGFWLKCMHRLLGQKVKVTKTFREIFYQIVPNCEKYEKYFQSIENFEGFDSFIDRIHKMETQTSCLLDTFRSFTHLAIQELEQYLGMAIQTKVQNEMIEKQKTAIEKINQSLQKQKNMTNELNIKNRDLENTIIRNMEENNRKIKQIENDARARENQLIGDINRTKNDLNRLQNEFRNEQIKHTHQLNMKNSEISKISKQLINEQDAHSRDNRDYEYKIKNLMNDFHRKIENHEINERELRSLINTLKNDLSELGDVIERQNVLIWELRNREPVVIKKKGCNIF